VACGGEVDYGQTPGAQANVAINKNALIIGTAMGDGADHCLDFTRRNRPVVIEIYLPCNTAHIGAI
jgi:hypothetical protein